MPISYRLNTKICLTITMLCLSGFELFSCWVPLVNSHVKLNSGQAFVKIIQSEINILIF